MARWPWCFWAGLLQAPWAPRRWPCAAAAAPSGRGAGAWARCPPRGSGYLPRLGVGALPAPTPPLPRVF
eukprot:bmy_07593T0